MKTLGKILLIILGFIVVAVIAFILVPKEKLLSRFMPKMGEIKITNLKVGSEVATMSVQTSLTNKAVPVVIDSIKYHLRLYGDNISSGTKKLTDDTKQTLTIPITLKYKSLAKKIEENEGDSTEVGVVVKAYYHLPLLGSQIADINKKIKVRIPIIPEVKITDIDVAKFGLNNIDMVVRMEVKNPNKMNFDIKNFKYDLKIKDYVSTSGVAQKTIKIEKYGTSKVEVPISVRLRKQPKAIVDIIKGDRDWEYTMNSKMTIDPRSDKMADIPLNMTNTGKVDILKVAKEIKKTK